MSNKNQPATDSDPIDVWDEHEKPIVVGARSPNGSVTKYSVHEFDKDGQPEYMKRLSRRMKRNEKASDPEFTSLQEDLIELCLRTEDGKPVPRFVIEGFGPKFKNVLYDKCQEINGLSDASLKREGKG